VLYLWTVVYARVSANRLWGDKISEQLLHNNIHNYIILHIHNKTVPTVSRSITYLRLSVNNIYLTVSLNRLERKLSFPAHVTGTPAALSRRLYGSFWTRCRSLELNINNSSKSGLARFITLLKLRRSRWFLYGISCRYLLVFGIYSIYLVYL